MDLNNLKEAVSACPITIVSTVFAVFLGIIYFLLKNRDLPPGPTGFPLLGYWPLLEERDIHLQLTKFKKQYGDVYSFSVAGKLFIHLGSIKSIKEAHITKSDCFSERLSDYSIFIEIFGKGLSTVNGEEWKTIRTFFIQAFREYGLTSIKDYMAGPIYDSVAATVESLKATKASPVNIISIINEHAAEIFRRMMFNDDEITDEELKGVLESYQNVIPIFTGKKLLLMGNFARYFIFPMLDGFKFSLENHKRMKEYLTEIIKRHEKTFSEENIRDVVDSYIKERRERSRKGDPSAKYFSDDALISSLVQLVGDGILGIAIFLGYFIHGLLEYPEEQEKMYQELEDVIGSDGNVTLEYRNKLPYTNAFILEVMRTTDFFTILPDLTCTKQTKLNGYTIPKGATTLMNLWAAQHDPELFDNPMEFKPSRYINEPGKPKTEAPIIFGVGKRSCAGESYTTMLVFLFLTTIVKHFRLERPQGNVKDFFFDGQMDVCAHPRK